MNVSPKHHADNKLIQKNSKQTEHKCVYLTEASRIYFAKKGKHTQNGCFR